MEELPFGASTGLLKGDARFLVATLRSPIPRSAALAVSGFLFHLQKVLP